MRDRQAAWLCPSERGSGIKYQLFQVWTGFGNKMNRKINFILQTIWNDNRKLLVLSAAQLPLQVLLPWLQIFLTRTLVMGIERQDPFYRYVAGIGSSNQRETAIMWDRQHFCTADGGQFPEGVGDGHCRVGEQDAGIQSVSAHG